MASCLVRVVVLPVTMPAEYCWGAGPRGFVSVRPGYREARGGRGAVRAEDNGGGVRVHAAYDHAQLRGGRSIYVCFFGHAERGLVLSTDDDVGA